MRRPGTPEEVAATIAFLASAGGGYITGTTVVIDGGRTRGAWASSPRRSSPERGVPPSSEPALGWSIVGRKGSG